MFTRGCDNWRVSVLFFVLEGTAFRCLILESVPDVPLVRFWGSIGTRIPIWKGKSSQRVLLLKSNWALKLVFYRMNLTFIIQRLTGNSQVPSPDSLLGSLSSRVVFFTIEPSDMDMPSIGYAYLQLYRHKSFLPVTMMSRPAICVWTDALLKLTKVRKLTCT